ncbi:uncharacterized protein N7483_008850 [Penicillium malachiteum]|uniref:uncharacterized protein n=1 Tax=Penicillium malachiteum TaxID=1324776 RepID=UPI002549B4D8|nr:uncharacterized protein N7483_008850 [Penicillium malachiteum]KAJ5720916.1 hypothetical protein N7483_008850 [Penicillium malachiteum]
MMRRDLFLLILVSFVAAWFVIYLFSSLPSYRRPLTASGAKDDPVDCAGNETLGFGQILVLSHGPSWRTRGLAAAASLTGLHYIIPPQPPVHPDLSDAFAQLGSDQGKDHPTSGGSRAWLAHLDLIKHVYQLNLETALIIEDDIDWDVSLRIQMKSIASAIRNLTHTYNHDDLPYGREWDIIWMGHCGEFWDKEFETVIFDDIAVCPHEKYHGWAQKYISRIPKGKRGVYWSKNPVCSFAYALSHDGARKVLELTGAGQGEAFDVKMMGECKSGNLKCISVIPEVIHQYFPAEDFRVKSLKDLGDEENLGSTRDDDIFESIKGSTENILFSARCRALWGETCIRD